MPVLPSPTFRRILWATLRGLFRRRDRRQAAALAAAQKGLDRRKP